MTYLELLKDANKFNTVLAVIMVVFILVVFYLVRLDLKIGKIERNTKD